MINRIATLLLADHNQLKSNTPLSEFGIGSLLATEFRSDMFRAFKCEVLFAVLING